LSSAGTLRLPDWSVPAIRHMIHGEQAPRCGEGPLDPHIMGVYSER
jgi:hypothetical protein